MNKDLQVGQRVKLSRYTTWDVGRYNPLDCEGTVFDIDDANCVNVKWDNGEWNEYLLDDVDLIPLD